MAGVYPSQSTDAENDRASLKVADRSAPVKRASLGSAQRWHTDPSTDDTVGPAPASTRSQSIGGSSI